MQAARKRGIGSWLGMFAIAMLFIGPPLGQWRAQLQREARAFYHAEVLVSAERAVASIPSGTHADHSVHQSPLAKAASASQIGVLTLDHCGYCQLAACFAALLGTVDPLPPLNWQAVAPLLPAYRAPHGSPVLLRQARAPPFFHA